MLKTVGESLHWSYANLAMAHAGLVQGVHKYGPTQYMIRARLFKGLRTGTMNMGALADDERLKLVLPQACCYCGSRQRLSVDHVIARHRGGPDEGDNMVWSCRSCNSSKGAKDMLEWLTSRGQFPALLLLRRYLKLAVRCCQERAMMETPLGDAAIADLPFAFALVPHRFPMPAELALWVVPLEAVATPART
ncbi:MAG TPA: HNH endonuclease signature motif containing protein [Polyangiaceae bacterium]|jgi:hypothetical protein|nr:HNH endonuclease signature motif containing protein [Polyangiaceae bacterium]